LERKIKRAMAKIENKTSIKIKNIVAAGYKANSPSKILESRRNILTGTIWLK
jgi:hypothetical protein